MDHWAGFTDFVAFESEAGGPSPNLKLIGAVPGADPWLAACYAAIYNTPGACVLWTEWPLERLLSLGLDPLHEWAEEHWRGLPVHSNRMRSNGAPSRLAKSMWALAQFIEAGDWEREDDYDRLWSQVMSVPSIGRYFGIKFAGALRVVGATEARQYDIRARGAKNGRRTLGMLYPPDGTREGAYHDSRDSSKPALEAAEYFARCAKQWIDTEYGLECDWFQFEALLCEYAQMVKGSRYPGKTSDADFDAYAKVCSHFGKDHPAVEKVLDARHDALPEWCRYYYKYKPLLPIYRDFGYVWSDALYDRHSDDLSDPEVLSTPKTDWEPLTRP